MCVSRGLSRQVGDEGGDSTDVCDDAKDDGQHGQPERLTWGQAGSLEISLRRGFVCLSREAVLESGQSERKKATGNNNCKYHQKHLIFLQS